MKTYLQYTAENEAIVAEKLNKKERIALYNKIVEGNDTNALKAFGLDVISLFMKQVSKRGSYSDNSLKWPHVHYLDNSVITIQYEHEWFSNVPYDPDSRYMSHKISFSVIISPKDSSRDDVASCQLRIYTSDMDVWNIGWIGTFDFDVPLDENGKISKVTLDMFKAGAADIKNWEGPARFNASVENINSYVETGHIAYDASLSSKVRKLKGRLERE